MPRRYTVVAQILREIALVVTAYYAYSITKNLIHPAPFAEAFKNAWSVVSLERALGIFQEIDLQRWLLKEAQGVVVFFNWVYTVGFWPAMAVTGVVFYVKDRDTYCKFRTIMLVSFVLGVAIFAIFPLAPPRFLGYMGFVDTIHLLGPNQYSSGSEIIAYNKYAAMPSMHFAWAFLISMAWASTSFLWAKIAAVVYQTLMLGAVVITGNHYFLDVIVAVPVIMLAHYTYQVVLAPSRPMPSEENSIKV
jgi:hypothetical protein